MRISRFWNALDTLTGAATDRREWTHRLGDEFVHAAPFLRSTGMRATSIACPSPGGEGCPRRIVHHDDGNIRAICGDSPKACQNLDLDRDDITILALDRVRLARGLAEALDISNVPSSFEQSLVFRIGSHDVFAGLGFPIFLTIPGPTASEATAPFDELVALPGPKLLLAPTSASIPSPLATVLDRVGIARLALHDILVIDGQGQLRPSRPTEGLFADLRAQVGTRADGGPDDPIWPLPPDARWEEISIRFIAGEVVNVTFRGETRRFEPDTFGLKSAKNGKPRAAWTYLRTFALTGGRLPVHHANAKETSRYQKQKQALSKTLRAAFGIADEPIPTMNAEYTARFVISGDDLQQGKQGQTQRNFVGTR